MDPEYTVIVAALTMLVLLPACYCDYRYRQVPNAFWWVIGIIGIVSIVIGNGLSDFRIQHILCVAGMVLILLDMLWFEIKDRRVLWTVHICTALCIIIPCLVELDAFSKNVLIIGIVFVVLYVLYSFGVIIGGADIKCLVTISFVFQTCPSFGSLPIIGVPSSLEYLFPFAFVVLFYAALISLVVLFWIVIRKMYMKTDPVKMVNIGCYTMSISEAKRSHVWARQDVRDGMVVNVRYTPDEGVYDRLESVGAKTVWVTPIIPFIIFITIGFAMTLIIGNVFFLPFSS